MSKILIVLGTDMRKIFLVCN